MKISDLLSKADEQTLQNLLGSAIFHLLKLLETNLTHPAKLQEILLTLHSPQKLLLFKPYRDILLDLLNPQQAKILIFYSPITSEISSN